MKNFFFPLIPNFECRESFSFGAKSEGHDVIGSELDNSKPEEGKCEAEKWSRRILRLGNGTSVLCPRHFFKGLLVGKCPNCCFFFFLFFSSIDASAYQPLLFSSKDSDQGMPVKSPTKDSHVSLSDFLDRRLHTTSVLPKTVQVWHVGFTLCLFVRIWIEKQKLCFWRKNSDGFWEFCSLFLMSFSAAKRCFISSF